MVRARVRVRVRVRILWRRRVRSSRSLFSLSSKCRQRMRGDPPALHIRGDPITGTVSDPFEYDTESLRRMSIEDFEFLVLDCQQY
jgi:hypothetical protein